MSDNKKSSISKRSSCYLLNLKQPGNTAKRLKLSFQRTSATVCVLKADRTVEASVGFLDVSETGAGVFTPELLNKGSVVELCITEPVILKVRGIIAWSAPVTSGIHQGKFKCRSGIQFVFDGESQLNSVKEFVKRAQSDPIENLKAHAPAPVAAADAFAAVAAIIPPAAPVTGDVPAMPPAPVAAEAPPIDAPIADAPVAAAPVAEAPAADAPVVAAVPPATEGDGTPDSGQQAA